MLTVAELANLVAFIEGVEREPEPPPVDVDIDDVCEDKEAAYYLGIKDARREMAAEVRRILGLPSHDPAGES